MMIVDLTNLFYTGMVIGFAIAAPVGPVGVLCVQRTLIQGRLNGAMSGLGAAVGDTLFGIVAAFGISWVADYLLQHQKELRVIGALVLLVMGVRALMRPPPEPSRDNDSGLLSEFATCFALTITNPITIMAVGALFAGSGVVTSGLKVSHASLLVVGVFAGSMLWFQFLVLTAGFFHKRINPNYLVWTNRVSGFILISFCVYVGWSVVDPDILPMGQPLGQGSQ